MEKNDLLHCHATLAILRFTYDLSTTDGPFLRLIQLCDFLQCPAIQHRDISIGRLSQLPRITLATLQSLTLHPQQYKSWTEQIDYILLGLSDEQWQFVSSKLDNSKRETGLDSEKHKLLQQSSSPSLSKEIATGEIICDTF